MKTIYIDTVGLSAGTTNVYNANSSGTYPVLTVTSAGTAFSQPIDLLRSETYAAVYLGTNGGTAGTGTFVLQLQQSNDLVNWVNTGSNGTLTIGTALALSMDRPLFHYIRTAVSGVSAGTLLITSQVITKSDSFQ